jgi:hypothetical protein
MGLATAVMVAGATSLLTSWAAAHAGTTCIFLPRTGQVMLHGEQIWLRADGEQILRFQEYGLPWEPWKPCHANNGALATLPAVTAIDIQLESEFLRPELIVLLGTDSGGYPSGPASGLENEAITLHGQPAGTRPGLLGIAASDTASHLTVHQGVIDLNGGWDNDPAGKLSHDTDGYEIVIAGGTGDDIVNATTSVAPHLTLYGNDGKDVLFGSPGIDDIDGGSGVDFLAGYDAEDQLHGGSGDDFLYGDNEKDDLEGGPGADHLTGGAGADECTTDPADVEIVDCEIIQ